jgi:cytochrome c oxidase subunit 2
MKKIIVTLMLVIGLVSALSACGSSGSSDSKGAPTAPSSSDGGSTITITASNFKFEPAEIKVKKGDKVTLKLDSKEGMHGISQPDLNIDLKKTGETVTFTADKTGTFVFACNVMCGAGHPNMKGKIIVE